MKSAEKRIKNEYTRVVKIADKWNTYIQIDNQGFTIVEQTTKKRATWFADMAAIALNKFLIKEKNNER
jgi:hypothetical protein